MATAEAPAAGIEADASTKGPEGDSEATFFIDPDPDGAFCIDAKPDEAAEPGEDDPDPPTPWTCELCNVTLGVRSDGRAKDMHISGKNHQKKLRAAGLPCLPPAPKKKRKHAGDSGPPDGPVAAEPCGPATLRSADGSLQSKSVLNEICQMNQWTSTYEVTSRGPQHDLEFCARAIVDRRGGAPEVFTGSWEPSKRMAETAAAAACLNALADDGMVFIPEKHRGQLAMSRGQLRWRLLQSTTTDELLGLFERLATDPEQHIQPDHLAATWNRLAHQSRESGRQLSDRDPRVWRLMHVTHAVLTTLATGEVELAPPAPPVGGNLAINTRVPKAIAWSGRELANVVHGVVVSLGLPGDGGREGAQILDACCELAAHLLPTCKPQELANLVWGCAPPLAPSIDRTCPLTAERTGGAWLATRAGPLHEGSLMLTPEPDACRVSRRMAKATHYVPAIFAKAERLVVEWMSGEVGAAPPDDRRACAADDASLFADLEALPLFVPQELTNLLYAFSRIGHAAAELFAAVAKTVSTACADGRQPLRMWSAQDLCNTLWACAAADARHEPFIAACLTSLLSMGSQLEASHLTQVQQWLIWWEVELGRPPVSVSVPLRQRCRDAMAAGDVKAGHTVSALQKCVGHALQRLGVAFDEELSTDEGYSIDFAIHPVGVNREWLPARLALEVDGPHHFTQLQTPTGVTLLKQRQLRSTGWLVVSVPFYEWYSMNRNPVMEEQYLYRCLHAAAASTPRCLPGATDPRAVDKHSNQATGWHAVPACGGPGALAGGRSSADTGIGTSCDRALSACHSVASSACHGAAYADHSHGMPAGFTSSPHQLEPPQGPYARTAHRNEPFPDDPRLAMRRS